MVNVLVLDDHSIVLAGVKMKIEEMYTSSNVDLVKTGTQLLEKFKSSSYDLIIVDINVPNTDTANLISVMLMHKPSCNILVFSMNPEAIYAKPYLRLGAKGFLNKDSDNDTFYKAIKTVISGKIFLSDTLIEKISKESIFSQKKDNLFESLTERELTISKYLAQGRSIIEICKIINSHSSTIGTHKARIFEKLNVTNIVELRELAILYNIPIN